MIVPPVAHRREIDRNLAEFFRGHRAAHFNRAIASMCRYFKLRRPRVEWFEYIDWGKTAGRTYEDTEVLPYTFGDVVKALNSVAANDWASFLKARLRSKSEHAPLGGITQAGWTLHYVDAPNQFELLNETDTGTLDAFYSIGLKVNQDGSLVDVRWGSPADIAGVGPDMKIVAVEGRAFSLARLKAVIQGAKDSSKPIMLSISNTGYERPIEIQWSGGERYPVLERQSGSPDLLTDISKASAIPAQR